MSTTLRKAFAFVVALVMAIAMIPASFAHADPTTETGSITINDAVPGQTYSVYQILYLESYNSVAGAYAYKANAAWEDWLKKQTHYVSFDAQGYVTWVGGDDAEAFAKLAQVRAASMTADATTTAPAADEGKTYSTVQFNNLKLGYYLVDTSLGTLCSLDTTNPNVVMQEKNAVPTNVKTVQEDSTNSYGEKNDANIGQTVNFQSTIIAQKGAQNYVFHDTMGSGLTYTGLTGITLTKANDNSVSDVDSSNYTVVADNLGDGCTFEVEFDQAFCDTLATGDKIVISYTATLNENAVIGGEGNPNTSKLSYGDSSNTKYTPDSQTKTYTWDLDVLKYGNGDETKLLSGAEFVLLNKDKSQVAIITNGKFSRWNDVPSVGENGEITWPSGSVLTTDTNGKIQIDGLDADTYYLREVKAPNGYNKLSSDILATVIGATTNADGSTSSYTTVVAKINNQSGTELPSTGGMGTTVFYVVGGILVVGAIVLLVARKRMAAGK